MITSLRVANFKSLKDVSVDFGRWNVLVGPNTAGKSNLISVFRFLRKMVVPAPGVLGLSAAVTAEGGFSQLAWRGGDSDLTTISLDGDFSTTEGALKGQKWHYTLEIVGDRSRGAIRAQNETLTVTGQDGERHLIRKDPGSGNRVLLSLSKGAISEVRDAERSALEFELPDWEGNTLRTLIASTQFYRLVPQLMKQVNAVTGAAYLEETGGNLSAWLMTLQTRHPEDFARITSAVRDVLPNIESLFTWPTSQSTVFISARERFLSQPVHVWELSDGALCLIALLSLIYSPPEYGAPLICVEEPENHLHPRLIHALIDLADQRRRELGDEAAQVLIATHSPQLLDKLDLDDILVVDKREGATVVTRPRDKPQLRDLLSREDLGLGDLFYSGALSLD